MSVAAWSSALPWAIVGLPMATGLALLIVAWRGRAAGASGLVGIVVAGATLSLSLVAATTRPEASVRWLEGVPLVLRVDALAAVMLLTLGLVGLAVIVVASREIDPDGGRAHSVGALLVLWSGSLAASMATSLLVLLVAWEVMALAMWPLLGGSGRAHRGRGAGAQPYLFLRAGDLGLYLAAVAAMVGAGTFEITLAATSLDAPWLHVAAAGLLLSALMKSAQLPFSIWLRRPFVGRAQPSAALAAAMMVVAGGYLLVRTYDIVTQAAWALPATAAFGGATALIMGLVALTQRDLLQALAASSASQKGFVLMGVGLATLPWAIGFVVVHGLFKALLFVTAAMYGRRLGTTDLFAARADRTRRPRLALAFTLGALALAGVPPLAGWLVKDEILAAALAASPPLYALALLATVVTALYASRLLWLVRDRSGGPTASAGADDTSRASSVAPALLATATIAASALLLPDVRGWWEASIGGPVGPRPAPWELAVTGALALAALVLTRVWQRAGRLTLPGVRANAVRPLRSWLGGQRGVRMIVVGVLRGCRALAHFDDRYLGAPIRVFGAARALGRFDDGRIGAGVDAVGRWGASVARGAARHDEGTLDALVRALAGAVGSLGRWARRPQTGLLHQYYAQASVALLVLALVLWLAS